LGKRLCPLLFSTIDSGKDWGEGKFHSCGYHRNQVSCQPPFSGFFMEAPRRAGRAQAVVT